MNKIGCSNYLSNDKESLIVAASDIEGRNCLPLDSNYISDQLKRVIKAVNLWFSDNEIINNFTPQVFPPSCQAYQ